MILPGLFIPKLIFLFKFRTLKFISKVSEVIHKRGIPLLSYIPPNTSGLSKIKLKTES